nr:unnamed protein product [Spirometra erinaceieuropaei]
MTSRRRRKKKKKKKKKKKNKKKKKKKKKKQWRNQDVQRIHSRQPAGGDEFVNASVEFCEDNFHQTTRRNAKPP